MHSTEHFHQKSCIYTYCLRSLLTMKIIPNRCFLSSVRNKFFSNSGMYRLLWYIQLWLIFLKLMGPNFVCMCIADLIIPGQVFVSVHRKKKKSYRVLMGMFVRYNAVTQWLENRVLCRNILTYEGESDRRMGPTA